MSTQRMDDMAVITASITEADNDTIPESPPLPELDNTSEKEDSPVKAELDKAIADTDKEAQEQERKNETPQETLSNLWNGTKATAKKAADGVANATADTRSALERVRTPGSILLPVGILLLLFFLVIPINGNSRLAWLWLVITGNASLPGGTPPGGGNTLNTPPPAPPTQGGDPGPLPGSGGQPPAGNMPTYQGNEDIS